MTGGRSTDRTDGTTDLSLSDYYDRTLVADVAVAPGGDRVAFTATEFDADEDEAVTSLVVVPADGSREPHRLTRADGASSPAWGPDGDRLAFLASREADVALRAGTTKADDGASGDDGAERAADDEGDGETEAGSAGDDPEEADGDDADDGFGGEQRQVWVFDLARGGDARQVTTRADGVSEFDWGPDGDRIVVAARDPTDEQREYLDRREEGGPVETERLQHVAEGQGYLDDVKTYLFVVDVETREARRLDGAYAGGVRAAMMGDSMFPAWGPGDRIAFVANHADDAQDSRALDLFTVDPDGGDLRRVTDGDVTAVVPEWSPDGDRLAFVAGDPENGHVPADLRVVGPDGAVSTPTAGLDRTVRGVEWTGDESVVAVVADGGQMRLYGFERDDGGWPGAARDAFPGQDEYTDLRALGVDPATGTVAVVLLRPNEQDAYVLPLRVGDGDGGDEPVRLTEYSADLPWRSRVACRRVAFESDPGVEVEGFAYYPADADPDGIEDADGDGDGDYPLVVDIHGGPMAQDGPDFRFRTHYWVARGYVVLNVNYRGSTSYGRAFSEAIRGDWGPRETADVAAGVDHLVDRGWVDPDRVFVTGFSQGGVNTAYLLSRTDVATAGAAEHGVYDLASLFGTSDTHAWYAVDFGLPWEDREAYRRASSITDVGEISAPLLVTAGEDDRRCPASQADQLYVSLRKRGVPSKLVVYPDLGHARGGPDVATHRLETVTDWFRRHDPTVEDGEG